tara:strand:+ start:8328 stop:8654 length:327 start_codon:yes stop_codon:yes gene_type:complete
MQLKTQPLLWHVEKNINEQVFVRGTPRTNYDQNSAISLGNRISSRQFRLTRLGHGNPAAGAQNFFGSSCYLLLRIKANFEILGFCVQIFENGVFSNDNLASANSRTTR